MPDMARNRSNPLGLAVMALLFERPMHPYEMASTLRERGKEQSIKLNYGSLYTVVRALERKGHITAGAPERAGARPERTVYALTASGRVALHDWLRDLLSVPVKEYPQFEAALSLMPILPPAEAGTLLEERTRRLGAEIQRLRHEMDAALKQGLDRLFLVETEYELAMREAERAWVLRLRDSIARSTEFTRPWRKWHASRPRTGPAGAAPVSSERGPRRSRTS